MIMDPRLSVIEDRLSKIRRIIAVASGKGGVGKTLIASSLSLLLAKEDFKVGLLDLDFHGPSCDIVLGIRDVFPKEEKGIIPPKIYGISFMSIIYFAEDHPLPLRGKEISNAIIELLAITRWGELDFLIVDLPPGMGDEALDTIRLMRNNEFLIVTTPSILSLGVVTRLVRFLRKINANIIGIIENMRVEENDIIKKFAEENDIKYLGYIRYDRTVESALGNIDKLLKTIFINDLKNITKHLLK